MRSFTCPAGLGWNLIAVGSMQGIGLKVLPIPPESRHSLCHRRSGYPHHQPPGLTNSMTCGIVSGWIRP